ncbi:MFS transporter [Acidianus ambivalens]|uniref:MFS transporter n=1 Tax=Acidianus ambivalens TaxID=2283 RepID=A0A650CY51_ACIAM|nr:MFS transporter [Acidianus ambivalens]MQL55000.1 MFS transporter [Acidianus ambivalens]QGR22781.1 MFS transporter [Acidianus ambivalens]
MQKFIHATISAFFSWAGNIYDLLIVTYVYYYFEKCLGLNAVEGTLLFALGLIFRVIGGYTFGKIADQRGRKPILIIGTAGYSAFQGLMAFSPNAIILLVARALQGLFMGAQWTAGTVIAYEQAPPSARGLINGIVQAGYGVGYALTGVAFIEFAPAMSGIGWRLFLLTGAIPIILLPYIILKVSDVKVSRRVASKVNVKEYTKILIRASIIISGMFFSYYSIFAVYPDLAEYLGLSKDFVGLMMTVANISLAISFIVYGRVADFINKRKLITYGVIGEIIGLPMMLPIIVKSPGLMLIGLLVYSIATGFWPLAPLLIVESVPPEVRSALTGLSYNLGSVVGGVGSITMGTLVQIFGLANSPLFGNILGYSSLLIVLITLLTWPRGTVITKNK